MPYTLNLVDTGNAIIATWASPLNFPNELEAFTADINTMLESQSGPVWIILDLGQLHFNMQEMFALARMLRHGEDSVLYHPYVYRVLWVTNNPDLAAVATALCEETGDSERVRVLTTRQDALELTAAAV